MQALAFLSVLFLALTVLTAFISGFTWNAAGVTFALAASVLGNVLSARRMKQELRHRDLHEGNGP
ncbi:hypothetical protein [Streptomyces sp. ODS28]|uniref:hypothetical protein n=1 Tax=Streptomyces sp. ODS28 TaxID=3136688 RepID=UPI0031F1673D